MGLLAQRVPTEELRGRLTRPDHVAAGEPGSRDTGQKVLVAIGQSLPLGSEALVAEALEEVAPIQGEGILLGGWIVPELGEALETGDIEIECRPRMESDCLLIDVEPGLGLKADRRDARPDEPEGLSQGSRGWAVDLRPELGRDRVAEPGSRPESQQGGQGLGMTARDPDMDAAGQNLEATEEANR